MTAEEMIEATLSVAPGLVDLIDGDRGLRLGPKGGLPDDGKMAPAIDYERISTIPFDDLTSGGDIDQVRMQINFWGDTAKQASDLAAIGREAAAPIAGGGIGTVADKSGPTMDIETRVWGVRLDLIILEERS